jgi:hypothetical protein
VGFSKPLNSVTGVTFILSSLAQDESIIAQLIKKQICFK